LPGSGAVKVKAIEELRDEYDEEDEEADEDIEELEMNLDEEFDDQMMFNIDLEQFEDKEEPIKDDTKPVAVVTATAPEKSKPDEKPSAAIKTDAIITGKDVPKNYIIKRLRDFDPNLFNYKTQGKLFSS